MDNSASNKMTMTKSSIEKQNVVEDIDCSKIDIRLINDPRTLHARYQDCCPYTRSQLFGTSKTKTPICKQMDKKFKELMNAHYIGPSEVQYGYLKENGDQSVMQPETSIPDLTIGGNKMKKKTTKKRKSSRNKKSSRKKKSLKRKKRKKA